MVVNWKNEGQKLFGNQLIKIGRQFIDENGGGPGVSGTRRRVISAENGNCRPTGKSPKRSQFDRLLPNSQPFLFGAAVRLLTSCKILILFVKISA